jgi:chloramphenicol 3-O phosphotransferase
MRSAEEEQQAYRFHCHNLRSTLARLVPSQFEIIVDVVLRDEPELHACLGVLSGRPMYLVGVRAPLGVLEERERRRDDRATGMAREQFDHAAFRKDYDLIIDTSTCTPVEGAAAIRRFIAERGAGPCRHAG